MPATTTFSISTAPLELARIEEAWQQRLPLSLSDDCRQRLQQCRAYLDDKLRQSDALFYGINTGFGSLCNIHISHHETEQLQENLVMSHACGAGDEAPEEVVRLMLLLKIQSLSYGFSAVRVAVVEHLIALYNAGALPVVYQLGSLGASGDLAPLAHLSLPLLGLGELNYQGRRQPAADVLPQLGLSPLRLQAKEGLALLNGTQFSTAYGLWCLLMAKRLLRLASLSAALSCDAFLCHTEPFDARLHQIRPHQGQQQVAAQLRALLAGSPLQALPKTHVQDPYAFRCIPQVHGASWDALRYVEGVVTTEINSVTDNPNVFADTDAILSGGNFHAQPIALALDFLAIALAEIGSISERRTYQLISGQRSLPTFLTPRPGLHSGLMIPQYTAAAIASQNKQLCTPASVDSIVSSNGQEDHVSMAANAGAKLYRVVGNVADLLAIEWMTAAQALEFRRPGLTSPLLEPLVAAYRQQVPRLDADRVLSPEMRITKEFLLSLNVAAIIPEH
jgi:histidine ammonia-lyase